MFSSCQGRPFRLQRRFGFFYKMSSYNSSRLPMEQQRLASSFAPGSRGTQLTVTGLLWLGGLEKFQPCWSSYLVVVKNDTMNNLRSFTAWDLQHTKTSNQWKKNDVQRYRYWRNSQMALFFNQQKHQQCLLASFWPIQVVMFICLGCNISCMFAKIIHALGDLK